MNVEYRSTSSLMIPTVVSSSRSPHDTSHRHSRSDYTASPAIVAWPDIRYFHSRSTTACFALPADPSCRTLPRFSVFFSVSPSSLLLTRLRACVLTRVPCACARECVRECVRTCHCHSISHFSRCARSFRSLHRCESCTKKSRRCGRQALPGRISLSGNVPTEQPTLALTLCPFRGVLWREPCLSLSLAHSFPLPISVSSPHSLLPRVGHPLASATVFSPSHSYPTPSRSPCHG